MSEKRSIPRSKIIGMQVYDPDAYYVGTVKDIGLVPGEVTEFSLIIQAKTGATIEVPWKTVEKVGDIIILKEKVEIPQPPTPTVAPAAAPPTVAAPTPTAAPTVEEKGKVSLPFFKKKEERICPKCGKPATWIEQYKRWYCYNCREYLPP